jgi:hypothetical protein
MPAIKASKEQLVLKELLVLKVHKALLDRRVSKALRVILVLLANKVLKDYRVFKVHRVLRAMLVQALY